MAKRAAAKRKGRGSDAVEGAVNARQPCPCGSGKRYKACHGSSYGPADVIVTRPFDGLTAECELIALREFVPSATAPLTLKEQGERSVTLATVLPMAAAALVRSDGEAFVGMQVQTRSGDISADLGRSIRWALTAKPGDVLTVAGDAREEARLQDVLAADAGLDVTVHSDFAWWIPGDDEPTGEVALSLQRANEAIMPTERVTGVTAAYWVDAGDKAHIRWVRPEPEEKLLAAMARLSAKGELDLGENTRYAGCFRAHGLLVPVWDIDREMHAKEWEQPVVELGKRLDAALATIDGEPLTEAERRSRDGLRGRQVTLR